MRCPAPTLVARRRELPWPPGAGARSGAPAGGVKVAKDWPLLVTIVDLIWGAVLAASVSIVTYLIADKIGV